MNIENHFNNTESFLKMAKEKLDKEDYQCAQAALASAYTQTRALLDHVQKLVVSKANVQLSEGGP